MDTTSSSSGSSGGGGGGGGMVGAAASTSSHTRDIVVPRLDEEMLSTSGNFAVVGQDSLPAAQLQPPLVTTPFMYDTLSPAHTVDASAVTLALLQQQQQQQQQVVAAAAAQLEQDYLQTRAMLQRCSRNALLMILTSLLDEFPTTMVGLVRLRLEQIMATRAATAAAAAAAQQQQQTSLSSPSAPLSASRTPNQTRPQGGASTFVPNSAAAPWTPSSQLSYLAAASVSSGAGGAGGGGGASSSAVSNSSNLGGMSVTATTPLATTSAGGGAAGSGTPYSSSPLHRRGRAHKSKEEEQEMCSVHNCMRSTKHLQLNGTTGRYECVHGFHCLVDSPLVTTPALQQQQSQQQQQQRDKQGGYEAAVGNGMTAPTALISSSGTRSGASTANQVATNNSSNSNHNASSSGGSGGGGNIIGRYGNMSSDGSGSSHVEYDMTNTSGKASAAPQPLSSAMLHSDGVNGFDALHDNARMTYDNNNNSPSDEVLKLDMLSLQNLLHSMREFDKEDDTA